MKLAKYYLLYFLLVILYTLMGIVHGEDGNTISFMFMLSILPSIILYLYNLVLTILRCRYFSKKNNNVIAFLIPIVLLVVFQRQFVEQASELDMGLDKFYWIIVVFSLMINLGGYFYTRSKLKE